MRAKAARKTHFDRAECFVHHMPIRHYQAKLIPHVNQRACAKGGCRFLRHDDPRYGRMWPQVLAAALGYGVFLGVLTSAFFIRRAWLRRAAALARGMRA